MSTLDEKKALRLKFMNALYELSDGDESVWIQGPQMAQALGLELREDAFYYDEDEAAREYRKTVEYLQAERLINKIAQEPFSPITITHKGIVEVERALENPEQPTRYFNPVATVINYVGTVVNSQIQQSGHESNQSLTVVNEAAQQNIEGFINSLRAEIDDLGLDAEQKQDIEAELRTIEAQLSGNNPKVPITRMALQSIKSVLENAAGNIVATAATGRVTEFMSVIDVLSSNLL